MQPRKFTPSSGGDSELSLIERVLYSSDDLYVQYSGGL